MNSRPERPPLERYLDQICRRLLFVSARERRETREELRQHLNTLAAHAARQVEPAKAMEEAMKKFGDPKEIGSELTKQHLRRRRWLSALLKTAMGAALAVLIGVVGYSAYWYVALSQPLEREPAPTPVASAASTLAAIEAAQDGYARQIQSVQFQGSQLVHAYYQGHGDRMETHAYQVAAKGDRYYSREVSDNRYGDGPGQISHEDDVYVSDGKTMRENLTEWNGPVSSALARQTHGGRFYLRDNNFKPHDPDGVLQYGYKVHGVWIGDMLRRGKPIVEGVVQNTQFGPLTVVRCRNMTSWGADEAVRLWLAPSRGWVAVKTETLEAFARPPFGLQTVHEARQMTKAGAFWMASEGRFHDDAIGAERRQEIADHPEHFSDIAVNDVPDSLFVVHYPVGTRILSEDFQKVSILQPSGQWKEDTSSFASNPASEWPYLIAGLMALGAGVGFVVITRKRGGWHLTT